MNNNLSYSIILFLSANHAVRAESVLLKESVNCKMIPVPRNISSECGVCVRIFWKDKEQALKILSALNIAVVKTEDIQ